METLAQVTAPHFVAGILFRSGKVVDRAPILARHIRLTWTAPQVWLYCQNKRWQVAWVGPPWGD